MATVATLEARISADASGVVRGGREAQQAVAGLQRQMRAVRPPVNQASFALLNVGRVLEDLPFGIRGVANNITPMIQSLQAVAVQSRAAGQSIGQVLLGALRGGGGLILAFSAATAAAQLLPDLLGDIAGEAEVAATSVGDLADELISVREGAAGVGFTEDQLRAAITITDTVIEGLKQATRGVVELGTTYRTVNKAQEAAVNILNEQARFERDIKDSLEGRLRVEEIRSRVEKRLLSLHGESLRRVEGMAKAERDRLRFLQRSKEIYEEILRLAAEAGAQGEVPVGPGGPRRVSGVVGGGLRDVIALRETTLAAAEAARELASEWRVVGGAIQQTLRQGLEPFFVAFTDGIGGVLVGLNSIRDVLSSIRFALSTVIGELLRVGVRAGIGFLVGGAPGAASAVTGGSFNVAGMGPGTGVGRVATPGGGTIVLSGTLEQRYSSLQFRLNSAQTRLRR